MKEKDLKGSESSKKVTKDNSLALPMDDQGNVDGNKVINFSQQDRERRNTRIERFFELTGLPVRLIGDVNNPAFIVDEALVLSAYVNNFDLRFTDVPSHGKVIYSVKLNHQQNYEADEFYRVILASEHRSVCRIQLRNTNLFLAGYNFINRSTSFGRYPVFSSVNPKIYFSAQSAEESIEAIMQDRGGPYDLEVTNRSIDLASYYSLSK